MYICNCNGLRERDIDAAIANACTRVRDVFEQASCEAQCGKCVREISDMIEAKAPAAQRKVLAFVPKAA